ncbi:MAG: hypothetical protein ACJ73E_04585 [Mycobacteriales bacterium]
MSVRPVGDLRRHVSHVSHAATALLVAAQSALEDVEGGVQAGQWELVGAQAQHLALVCLHVRGLAAGAEPHFWDDTAAGDPYAGVPEDEVEAALRLVAHARRLPGTDPGPWLERVRALVAGTEATVQLAVPLPELRSPAGLFGGVRLVRGWSPLVEELDLPPMLPGEWTEPL